MELGTCRCARWAAARNVTCGKARNLAFDEVFFSARVFAGGQLFGHEEAVGRDTQACMMMEAAPTSPLIMAQPQLLLQFQVIALDAPAHLCCGHQIVDGSVLGQRRQPVLGRFALVLRPFDEQPLAWPQARVRCCLQHDAHVARKSVHSIAGCCLRANSPAAKYWAPTPAPRHSPTAAGAAGCAAGPAPGDRAPRRAWGAVALPPGAIRLPSR